MSSPALPLLISTKLPDLGELQKQLQGLMDRLATYPVNGGRFYTSQRQTLQKQIDATRAQLKELTGGDTSGVPPAPDKPAILGPRIETPKVGLNDLKILLPPR